MRYPLMGDTFVIIWYQLFYFKMLKYNSLSLKYCTICLSKLNISALFIHYKHTPVYKNVDIFNIFQ